MRCVSRLSLVRTTSFRLAALYLLLFTLSALALGAFVYLSVRHEILADFDERIVEETDSLQRIFATQGKEKLAGILEARGSSGGARAYGLLSPEGKRMAGNLEAPAAGAGGLHAGWSVLNEAEDNEAPEDRGEVLR